MLRSLTDIKLGTLPFIYLGVPLFSRAPKKIWLQPLVNKVLSKFDNWKGHSLSMAGRIALVSSMIYKWPSSLLKRMEKAIRNFIWTGSIHFKKLIMVKWDVCSIPKDEGGLSLRRLHTVNSTFLSKLSWRVCEVYF